MSRTAPRDFSDLDSSRPCHVGRLSINAWSAHALGIPGLKDVLWHDSRLVWKVVVGLDWRNFGRPRFDLRKPFIDIGTSGKPGLGLDRTIAHPKELLEASESVEFANS